MTASSATLSVVNRDARRSRSVIMGTHDTPASERAIFKPGNRTGMRAKTQSTEARRPPIGNSAVVTAPGDSAEGRATRPDEPTWRLITVSVSAQAAKKGSQNLL